MKKQVIKSQIKTLSDLIHRCVLTIEEHSADLHKLEVKDGKWTYLAAFRMDEAKKQLEDAKENLWMVYNSIPDPTPRGEKNDKKRKISKSS